MPVRGVLKADGIAVARVEIDRLTNPNKVKALAAFTDSSTGQTVGWTEGTGGLWSEGTLRKIRELCEAMEEDLARALFTGGGGASSSSGGVIPPSGLGEHLHKDAPSA